MSIKIYSSDEIPQGSEKWKELRSKFITGTDAYDLIHGKPISLILQEKANTTFTGNFYTKRGHLLEDEARKIYSEIYEPCDEAGFITNSKYPLGAMSPDGLVSDYGLIEIKAFQEKRHLDVYEYLDPHIIDQIQFGLFISERKWCDFICYNPEIEDVEKAFLVKRQFPIPSIQQKFTHFLKENT